MRFLKTPNQFQLRLGWLSMPSSDLNWDYLSAPQDDWLDEAGLVQAPLGRLSRRAEPDIARMAVVYGVEEPQTHQLTELGQVFRAVGQRWRRGSIFSWPIPRGFIGLKLVVDTWGDLLEELILTAPEQEGFDAVEWLKGGMLALFERAEAEEKARLQTLISRFDGDTHKVNTTLLWPHFEPLRELGLLERTDQYRLTVAGRRLVNEARHLATTESGWSRDRLAKLYLAVIDRPPGGPAPLEALRVALRDLPTRLLRASGQEASLEAVVLLAQCHLLAAGDNHWLEVEEVARRLAVQSEVTAGRIGLKRGLHVGEHNIAWSDPAVLEDPLLWVEPTERPVEERQSAPPPPLSARERLWFQYALCLLDPARRACLTDLRYGGIRTALRELEELLDLPEDKLKTKRINEDAWGRGEKKGALAVLGLSTMLSGLDLKDKDLTRVMSVWGEAARPLGPTLHRAKEAWRLHPTLTSIENFLRSADPIAWPAWPPIAELTRIVIDDLLQDGTWEREDLRQALVRLVDETGQSDRVDAALACLRAPTPVDFRLIQAFEVAPAVAARVRSAPFELEAEEAKVEVGPGREDQVVVVYVDLRARSVAKARSLGLAWAHDALARLTFLAGGLSGGMASTKEPQLFQGERLMEQGETQEAEVELRPDLYGFLPHPEDDSLVTELPHLIQLEHGELGARERLAAALHWLHVAGAEANPAERLGHSWVAIEHLVSAGRSSKGGPLEERFSVAMAFSHLGSIVASIWRDAAAALHIRACLAPQNEDLLAILGALFGTPVRETYASRLPGIASATDLIPADLRFMTARTALELAIRHQSKMDQWASLIESDWPLAAWRLKALAIHLKDYNALVTWLVGLRQAAGVLLQHVYHLRNRLVHEARPFAFEQSSRLDDLQQQFRFAIDPAIRLLLRLVGQGEALDDVWSDLTERLRFLEEERKDGPKPDLGVLFRYLP